MLVMGIPFNAWIILMFVEFAVKGIVYAGWACLFGFFFYATGIRNSLRNAHQIKGNIVEDFFVMMLYPLAVPQICDHVQNATEAVVPLDNLVFKNEVQPCPQSTETVEDGVFEKPGPVTGNGYPESTPL